MLDNGDIKYDEDGLTKVLSSYNLDNTYKHKLSIRNIETDEMFTGEINSLGILEFKDIPYVTYESVEEDDEYFILVGMLEISKVEGIEYTPSNKGWLITIKPTGNNILYGINIINKIPYKIDNPNTNTGIKIILLILTMILILIPIFFRKHIKIYKTVK